MGQSPVLAVLTRVAKPPSPTGAGPVVSVASWGRVNGRLLWTVSAGRGVLALRCLDPSPGHRIIPDTHTQESCWALRPPATEHVLADDSEIFQVPYGDCREEFTVTDVRRTRKDEA